MEKTGDEVPVSCEISSHLHVSLLTRQGLRTRRVTPTCVHTHTHAHANPGKEQHALPSANTQAHIHPVQASPPGPGLGARPAQRSAAASPPAPKAAAAPAAATAKAALRPVPQPRTPGPHWQRESPPLGVFPKTPSSRAPAGPRLPRPFPPRAAAAPGTSGTRRANFLQGL